MLNQDSCHATPSSSAARFSKDWIAGSGKSFSLLDNKEDKEEEEAEEEEEEEEDEEDEDEEDDEEEDEEEDIAFGTSVVAEVLPSFLPT